MKFHGLGPLRMKALAVPLEVNDYYSDACKLTKLMLYSERKYEYVVVSEI